MFKVIQQIHSDSGLFETRPRSDSGKEDTCSVLGGSGDLPSPSLCSFQAIFPLTRRCADNGQA